jgi:type IV fimbrial biogenesis protein FimT
MLNIPVNPIGRSPGFSLIELLVVLAIIAITMVLGMRGISDWMQSARTRTAAEGVKNGLQAARTEAIRSNKAVAFTLSNPGAVGGTGWTITAVRTGTVVQSQSNGEGSGGAVLAATPNGATTATFTGLGRLAANNQDASPVLTRVDISGGTLRITISAGGEIRMCNPTVTVSGDPTAC